MHVSSNRLWHKSQREKTFRKCVAAHCVYEGCVLILKQLSLLTSVNLSALCPGVFQDHYHEFVLPLCFFINCYSSLLNPPNNSPPHPLTSRFADSIRGMLKLILVLMLAGASLSSTWFTLTCLSRVTHLPATAGGSKAASLSRWHCVHTCRAAGRVSYTPKPKLIQ